MRRPMGAHGDPKLANSTRTAALGEFARVPKLRDPGEKTTTNAISNCVFVKLNASAHRAFVSFLVMHGARARHFQHEFEACISLLAWC